MKVQQFLEHHGITENPFGQEDATSDHVFRKHCLTGTHHPAWDKIYGNPESPSTAVVFGEKGSGKTALRMQIAEQIRKHNAEHPDRRTFIIEYDDFNPFLDTFRERIGFGRKSASKVVQRWRLWDHMDAILKLGVTRLVQAVLDADHATEGRRPEIEPNRVDALSDLQKRDLLLLAAFYHHSYQQAPYRRWNTLRRRLKYPVWKSYKHLAIGILATILVVTGAILWYDLTPYWMWIALGLVLVGWLPWLWKQTRLLWRAWRVSRQIRVFDHMPNALRKILSGFDTADIAGQPMPDKDRSDDRYELLEKLQSVLRSLGFENIVVLVDRVDEPHLMGGSPERIKDLLWPMFDNKFLKHPGMGFKLLLPSEVVPYLNREEREFYERSRLDKQNLVQSLQWSGESLYDVANDRIRACANSSANQPELKDLFEDPIGEQELIGMLSRLRVPRHLFKFLYRLLVDHCNRYTDKNPNWKINRETMQSTLALYMRDLDALDRGMGTG